MAEYKTLEINDSINLNNCRKYNLGYCYSTTDGKYLGKYLKSYSQDRPRQTAVDVHKFEHGTLDGDTRLPSFIPSTNLVVRVECQNKPLEKSTLDESLPAYPTLEAIPVPKAIPLAEETENDLPLADAVVSSPKELGVRYGGKSKRKSRKLARKSRSVRKSKSVRKFKSVKKLRSK
jgi:hypothetical protein